jgi:hypothetical protein
LVTEILFLFRNRSMVSLVPDPFSRKMSGIFSNILLSFFFFENAWFLLETRNNLF